MNRYPAWKYVLIFSTLIVGGLCALPNIYGKQPALQISGLRTAEVSELTLIQVESVLEQASISAQDFVLNNDFLTVLFTDEETQLKAKTLLQQEMGKDYVIALNLTSDIPDWLRRIGLEPIYLGLDLRGGVYFLMEVDMRAAIKKAEESYLSELRSVLREEQVRYENITRRETGGIFLGFADSERHDEARAVIDERFANLQVLSGDTPLQIILQLTEAEITETKRSALQQNIVTLRKRVNELGVAEPIIQQQGTSRIVVQLPGVQDPARAKEILGATATLEFRFVNEKHDVQDALDGKRVPGAKLYYERNGQPVLLEKRLVISGDRIINAGSGFDQITGSPEVSITLDGKGAHRFSRATRDKIGSDLAVVFIENQTELFKQEDGSFKKKNKVVEEVISVASIREQLGKRFRITGLSSSDEARNLALLLRAGALAAPIQIVEERTVGPSLGQDNINQGTLSVIIGFLLVLIFISCYYKVFGIVAAIALSLNLVLIVSMLSILQATLTLPGIAGIVLTVGMAIDANVLIFERIREELRNGNSPHKSIDVGYDKAFLTISDANITTLIAALMLFSFGTGPIKGFAVTLSLGVISSMFTAILVSRALINLIYGKRHTLKKLAI